VKKTASADDHATVLMALTAWDVVSVTDKHGVDAVPVSSVLHTENRIW